MATGNPPVQLPIDRPARIAPPRKPPSYRRLAVLLAQLTLCPIAAPSPADLRPASRSTRSHTHSNTLPTGTGHNVLLGDRPASQQGARSFYAEIRLYRLADLAT